ncbi:WD repeat [Cryptosporidium bovis]|uniref:WD repeat n=1 Tax=Cryptosporidium bovis TaxID=310047 RepID=UPI00351A7EDB|nr:WD repeat [Cryptosporidium bovis]
MKIKHSSKLYPKRIYRLFEKKNALKNPSIGLSEVYHNELSGLSKVDSIILRDSRICNIYTERRSCKDIITPKLLQNVTFYRGECANTCKSHIKGDSSINGMITSIDSHRNIIAVSNSKGLITLYNTSDVLCYRDLNNGKGPFTRYPLGYVLTEDQKISLERGKMFRIKPIILIEPGENNNHRGVISNLCMSQVDGQLFVTTGWDGKFKVWDTIESYCVYDMDCKYRVNHSGICPVSSNIIGLCLNNGTVKVFDLRMGQVTQELYIENKITNIKGDNLKSPIMNMSWREDSDFILATATKSGHIRLWDLRFAPQPYLYMSSNELDWGYIQETSYVSSDFLKEYMVKKPSINSKSIDCIKTDNYKNKSENSMYDSEPLSRCEQYFLETGKVLKDKRGSDVCFSTNSNENTKSNSFGMGFPCEIGHAHESGINCIEFINNGRNIVSSSFDGTIKLWNTLNGKNCYVSFDKYDSQTLWMESVSEDLGYSIDNKYNHYFKRFSINKTNQNVLYHPHGNDIGIWNIRTGRCEKRLSAHMDAESVNVIHSSRDLNQIVSGDQNGDLFLWRV